MNVGLVIAGVICVALAVGHATLGLVWVLPGLTKERLPRTPFGPPSMTVAMVRATWHIVTVFALTVGGLLMTLAWDETGDPKTVTLRWLAAMWMGVAATAVFAGARRVHNLRDLLRLPVPVFFVIVAVLCWLAST